MSPFGRSFRQSAMKTRSCGFDPMYGLKKSTCDKIRPDHARHERRNAEDERHGQEEPAGEHANPLGILLILHAVEPLRSTCCRAEAS